MIFHVRQCKDIPGGKKSSDYIIAEDQKIDHFHEYCIIGAGPGGLQLAYYMHKAGRDYIVYEKESQAGSFFQKYPINGRLRGINKGHTGCLNKEIQLRFDLNSLISHNDSLKMTKYSSDLFPSFDDFVRYLNDFSTTLKLNVQYNTAVSNVEKYSVEKSHMFRMNDQRNRTYNCHYVIVATGTGKPIHFRHKGSEYVDSCEDVKLDPNDYEGKSVLILGESNMAFEVANYILPFTASVHVATSNNYDFAWKTHYQGHLDAAECGIFDTYLLKSLDGIFVVRKHLKEWSVNRRETDGKLFPSYRKERDVESGKETDLEIREGYDKIIQCVGYQWDVSLFLHNVTVRFAPTERNEMYPVINLAYESLDVRKLYFAGSLTHSLDYKKSAGGFIHGFRYTAKCLHHMLEWKHYGIKWPSVYFDSLSNLVPYIAQRMSEGSDIFHMHGVLCDIVIYNKRKTEASYLQGLPCLLASKLKPLTGHSVPGAYLIISMEYGKNYHQTEHSESDNLSSSYFRPVLRHYEKCLLDKDIIMKPKTSSLPVPDRMHIVSEDLTATYKNLKTHILPIRRFIEQTTKTDLRFFFAHQCLMLKLTATNLPLECQPLVTQNSELLDLSSTLLHNVKDIDRHLLPFHVFAKKNMSRK